MELEVKIAWRIRDGAVAVAAEALAAAAAAVVAFAVRQLFVEISTDLLAYYF